MLRIETKRKIDFTIETIQPNSEKITLESFKNQLSKKVGIKIDFRIHMHIKNNYGLMPVVNYSLMKKIVNAISDLSLELGGRTYNVTTRLERLRTSTLKLFIHQLNPLNWGF